MPTIFHYTSHRTYLRAWLGERGGRTLRGLAERVDCSPALLSAILNADPERRRRMHPPLVEACCEALELEADERDYFRLLVDFDQGQTEAERQRAWECLAATRNFHGAHRLAADRLAFFAEWYHPAIYELARCEGFCPDPAWIARTLQPRIPIRDAQRALNLLLDLGLLEWTAEGALVPVADLVRGDEDDESRAAADEVLKRWYRWMLRRASTSMDAYRGDVRVVDGATVALPASLVPELERRMQGCIAEVLALGAASDEPPDRVFQVGMLAFPISDTTQS